MDTMPAWEPPSDLDAMPEDPFPYEMFTAEPPDFEYQPEDDPFTSFPTVESSGGDGSTVPPPSMDQGWLWHDAALIALEQMDADGEVNAYTIGMIDVYANVYTGDLGGWYLEMDQLEDLDEAVARYHELQWEIHDRTVPPFHLAEFADQKVQERAATRGKAAPTWEACSPTQYAAYEAMRSVEALDTSDSIPRAAPETEAVDRETTAFKALREIGIAADGFDPQADPPPFIDPQTGTAYWIGIFQPDRDDPSLCLTSILSLGRNPTTGEVEAQLAPCVPGDWDKAYSAAEYLLGVMEKGGIEQCFDAAEGMALVADQRMLWSGERGISLEPDTAHELADYAREQWEFEL